jgi:c-di-GMP-binding flagellar brake protein YcgR
VNLENILKTGNEVRVRGERDTFITTIDEVSGEDTFTILAPNKQGGKVTAQPAERFLVSCVTDRGLYLLETRVTEIDDSSNVLVIHLAVNGEPRRVQRREAFRVRESISVSVRKKSADVVPDGKWVKTCTVDIAELGMLLKFDENCDHGQELEMSMRINLFGLSEVIPKVRGKVVRCISTRNKEYGFLLGIKFEDMPEKARDALIKLVVLSQRSKMTYKNIRKLR